MQVDIRRTSGTTDYDVAIVGLGPVGAVLANLLGLAGIRTVVLERDAGIHDLRLPLARCRSMLPPYRRA